MQQNKMRLFIFRPRFFIALLIVIIGLVFVVEIYKVNFNKKQSAELLPSLKHGAGSSLSEKHGPVVLMSKKYTVPQTVQKTKYNKKAPSSDNSTLRIVQIAKQINARGRPLLLALINDAYMPFTYSWLCNTMYMGIHQQVLFITTDDESRRRLQRDWPAVSAVTVSGLDVLSGDQEYSQAGYVRLMVRRTEIILAILREGVTMLLFEVDCLWFANPIPVCEKNIKENDIVASAISDRPGLVAAGFLYMLPTQRMVKLWDKLTENLRKLDQLIAKLSDHKTISEGDNDQTYFNRLVKEKYAGIRVNVLPFNIFADGRWYKMLEKDRNKIKPLIVNNNWVSGNKVKIRRAKKYGHWFWKDKTKKCDTKLVNQTVYTVA